MTEFSSIARWGGAAGGLRGDVARLHHGQRRMLLRPVTETLVLVHCCRHTFFPGPLGSCARLLLALLVCSSARLLVCCSAVRLLLALIVCSPARD